MKTPDIVIMNVNKTRLKPSIWLVPSGECVWGFFGQCVLVIEVMCNMSMFGYQQLLCGSLSKSIKI